MAEIPMPADLSSVLADYERRIRLLETRPSAPAWQYVDTYERCTSASYASLSTTGPSVTATVGQSKLVVVTTSAYMEVPSNTTAVVGLFIDDALAWDTLTLGNASSGALALNTTDTRTIQVNPGTHTFELRYKQSLTEVWFSARQLIVQPY